MTTTATRTTGKSKRNKKALTTQRTTNIATDHERKLAAKAKAAAETSEAQVVP